MNIPPLTATLLLAAVAAAPMAEAVPVLGAVKTTRKAKSPLRKKTGTPRPAGVTKPAAEPKREPGAVAHGAIPAEAFSEFMKRLDMQVKENSYDACPAMEYLLTVTGEDDLALEEWMKKAVAAGNAAARYYMANRVLTFIQEDKIDSKEVKDAVVLLRKAADQGFIPAKLDLALCQMAGRGMPKNESAAKATLAGSYKSGSIEARFKGLALTGRLQNFSDMERQEVKYEIERGNHHILYYMSASAPNADKQLELLKQAASLGNSEALFTLSSIMHDTDVKNSFQLLQESAKLHNHKAIFVLGSFLLEPGLGKIKELNLTKDLKNGLHLIRLASMLGNAQADLALANAYYSGQYGLEVDKAKAFQYFNQAYEVRGDVSAAASTGYMLLKGEGVPQDTGRGLKNILRANQAGYPYAAVLMAYASYNGLGCEADGRKAMEYLQDAAAMRLPVAYVFMAYITAKGGPNLPANASTAESYLRMAELDMGENARKIYDETMKEGKWEPRP